MHFYCRHRSAGACPPRTWHLCRSRSPDLDPLQSGDRKLQTFMRLPLAARRRLLAQQAEQMKAHYKQAADEPADVQIGNFIAEAPL